MDIIEYANRYDARYKGSKGELTENEVRDWLVNHRFLDKEHFLKLCIWKWKRPVKHYESNSDTLIQEITRFSFSTECEEARIKSLLILKGVCYPAASAILHFAFSDLYPILDFRVIWALGWPQPNAYAFSYWERYCATIRGIAEKENIPIRTVDKAYWEYSKENQRGW
ncbi:MAG: hypothetical protein ABSH41_25785 [Syntrophobacteraceae bacterium]|jgi:hypothetical protein